MFSDGILFQSADQHGIVDYLQTGKIVNNIMRKICIGDHVCGLDDKALYYQTFPSDMGLLSEQAQS